MLKADLMDRKLIWKDVRNDQMLIGGNLKENLVRGPIREFISNNKSISMCESCVLQGNVNLICDLGGLRHR